MQNYAANIYCPNPDCKALNLETKDICEKCGTPLPRRFLWALHEGKITCKPGEILAERYLYKGENVFLDLQPGLPPMMPEEVPPLLAPYLKLFPERLHVPQVYGLLPRSQSRQATDIWLLEEAPLAINSNSKPDAPLIAKPKPKLIEVWKNSTAMRQLNWLWQIAKLWQPASEEKVASSLLNENLLRVEGSFVRLLQLEYDRLPPSLSQLAAVWKNWVAGAHPLIARFLERLCQQILQKRVRTSQELVAVLDCALRVCGRAQQRSYYIATGTDTGPSRRRNEDACYPPTGTTTLLTHEPLVIVCDGIGGHEGGNVASHMAIDAILEHITPLQGQLANINPQTLSAELEKIICKANDVIGERNNDEQRQGRQRMGTTVVMALGSAHQIYLAHVGDSRAYWIGREGCYQLTLDDDLASREVRLGYALYRDAIQQPASGSLVQALGMNPSELLHPTVRRLIIDEDSLFLLCSDGLSDNDRVEQYWEKEILPVLEKTSDLRTVVERLIWLANTENSHDNVTVALLYCNVQESQNQSVTPEAILAEVDNFLSSLPNEPTLTDSDSTDGDADSAPTILQSPPSHTSALPWLVASALILLTLSGGAVLAYFLSPPEFKQKIAPLIGLHSPTNPKTTPLNPSALPSPKPSTPTVSLNLNSFIQIQISTPDNGENYSSAGLQVYKQPVQNSVIKGIFPEGSLLKIIKKITTKDNLTWLELQFCSSEASIAANPDSLNKNNSDAPYTLLKPGDTGWILEKEIFSRLFTLIDSNPQKLGKCAPPPASTPASTSTSTPTPTVSPQY
ncbi:MAG: protein phosphatase 2C domain-containing protein [Oscillatoriaceae bacterium SKW80]|nr:protein phosphatase 2C domain-containing protein [Oscillatoriaceae bacterium SKYG93]MCX8121781.1 protein phosphatase 2C domain-containing protein [Oscillatoriaceae bacterium SKW80]MDW8452564.1 protein phosphatase 2C domain-containing protein [Oscillatoriaceae cyanobacterium SKYGB_i_bin93]HIK28667.1 protein phosphatase 2C domain-containing protein [Oscillatoriaceae cyanobacterium M7585_C2015_266]